MPAKKKSGNKNDELMPVYGTNDYKELNLIAQGRTMNMDLDAIIDYLAEHDIDIKRRTLSRRIETLANIDLVRLRNMPEEYKHEYLKRIDTLQALQTKLWEFVNNTEYVPGGDAETPVVSTGEKIKAMAQIQSLQMDLQMFYNAGPIVHGMMRAIDESKQK